MRRKRRKRMIPFLSICSTLVAISFIRSSQSIIYDNVKVKKDEYSPNKHFSKDSSIIDSISHSEHYGEDSR